MLVSTPPETPPETPPDDKLPALALRLEDVRLRISQALAAAGRGVDACRLVAVSKTFPVADVRALYGLGQHAFGENYVQELQEKVAATQDLRQLEWHFIGPLQSNKTRPVAEHCHWVHTVDRLRIAERLSAQRPGTLPPLNVCLQVNISAEASKSGCAPQDVAPLARAVQALPGLRLRGLMCIPEPSLLPAQTAESFRALARLAVALADTAGPLDTLSMGMSADLETAVAEGATLVRVGTALFGQRPPPALNSAGESTR